MCAAVLSDVAFVFNNITFSVLELSPKHMLYIGS